MLCCSCYSVSTCAKPWSPLNCTLALPAASGGYLTPRPAHRAPSVSTGKRQGFKISGLKALALTCKANLLHQSHQLIARWVRVPSPVVNVNALPKLQCDNVWQLLKLLVARLVVIAVLISR